MTVDRCICLNRSFAEIKEMAEEGGYSSVSELQENDICSTQCKLCLPYIGEVLRTGKTKFVAGSVYNTSIDTE